MTETQIQNLLSRHLYYKRVHRLTIPNNRLWGWEMDLLSFTPANMAWEFEIKCSMSDFMNDKRKRKFSYALENYDRGPNYFCYCLSHDLYPKLVKIEKGLRPYMGLWFCSEDGIITEARKPKRLRRYKVDTDMLFQLMRGVNIRYWNQRWRINE